MTTIRIDQAARQAPPSRAGKESANPLASFRVFVSFLHSAAGHSVSACGEIMRAFGNRGLVRTRKIPHFGESCGENQAFFLWAASLKQEPTEVIQESCLAPERGRNPPPSGGGGCQRYPPAAYTSTFRISVLGQTFPCFGPFQTDHPAFCFFHRTYHEHIFWRAGHYPLLAGRRR